MKIRIDDATLHAEADGPQDAPAVLLWHGANCTLRSWDLVVARLADRYRLIRFDVRGHGESAPAADPDTGYTFERYADDANGLLEHFGVRRCHVWGFAWGARSALAYAALHPGRAVSAALYDASIGQPDVKAQREGTREAVRRQRAAGIRFQPPEGWNVHADPDAAQASLAAMRRFDLPAAIDRLTMPVLIATGDLDPNLASSRDLVARAADARLVVLADVGHGSVLQRPDLSVETWLEFQESLL
ncbi:MAG: alpha/beta fold hydrolase [Gammaproteobacteria bacterium]|nr:alpha/beta fold hydrolase [Gammaproteobacteria bacterium]